MKLSVVIPVYNSIENIIGVLDSLVNQTFKDFVVIFVDDGSTDNSAIFIRKHLSDFDIKFEIVSTNHRGVSHARNEGLKKINSEYTIFLDSDDYIEAETFEVLIRTSYENNLDVAWCGYDHIRSGKKVWDYFKSFKDPQDLMNGIELLNNLFENKHHIITSSVVYRTTLFEGLEFNEYFSYHEDLDFFYRVISRATRTLFINKILIHYVIRDDSLSHKLDYEKLNDGVGALKSLHQYLMDQRIVETIADKLYTLVIPRTLYIFYSHLCSNKVTVDYFENNGFFGMMSAYRVSILDGQFVKWYLKIKFAANYPKLFRKLKIIYIKVRGNAV